VSGPLANVTAVAVGCRAILVEGPPGSGKSSLALALIDRGATLVGDDAVTLAPREGRLWAAPPPNVAGKLEIRNLGLIDLPTAEAAIALVVRLDPGAPRFIDAADTVAVAGHPLPLVRLWPDTPLLALRAEWALRRYGLA